MLSDYPTYELVDELTSREGVDIKKAGPYEDVHIDINGPAVILVVKD